MKFRIKYIAPRFCIIPVLFIILFFNTELRSQDKYVFDFNEDWEWYDLMLSDWCQHSTILTSYVKTLKEEFTIEEGRMLFRNLAKLDSLNQIIDIITVPHLEADQFMMSWRTNLDTSLIHFNQYDTFDGILTAAYFLSKFHVKDYFTGNYFKKRKYYENTTPAHTLNIKLDIEYFPANYLLDLFDRDYISEDDIQVIDTSETIKSFYDTVNNPGMNQDRFLSYIKFAQRKDPIAVIFKIINPVSFGAFGGVSLYSGNFGKVISTLRNNEKPLREESLYLLSLFLPDGLIFKTKAYLSFGSFNDTIRTLDDAFFVRLEDFGDDYDKYVKLLARGVFKVLRDDQEININPFLVKKSDSLMLAFLDNIYYTSCINYIASEFKEDIPSVLLEKNFVVFNKTTEAILKNNDTYLVDSLFNIGFNGQSLYYYTLGMQVANYIDRFSGKKKLKNALTLGSIYFFDSYIEMYENNSLIRNVFTFQGDFESKVHEWSALVNYDMQLEILEAQKLHGDSVKFFEQINILNNKYKNDLFVFNLLIGQMLYKWQYYNESLVYFRKALPLIPNKTALNIKIAKIEEQLKELEK